MGRVHRAWARAIRTARQQRLWSAKHLARRLIEEARASGGTAPTLDSAIRAVRRWEAGENYPDDVNRWLLAKVFGTTEDRLFGKEVPQSEPQVFVFPAASQDLIDSAATDASTMGSQGRRSSHVVFIQYLNPEILQLYGIRIHFHAQAVARVAVLLSRYALIASESMLVMPASYLFEVPFINDFIEHLAPLREAGLLGFTSPSPDLGQYVPTKRHEYRSESTVFSGYFNWRDGATADATSLLWIPRVQRSSAEDIALAWHAEANPGGLWDRILARNYGSGRRPRSRTDGEIDAVPARLDGRAFVARYARPLIPVELSPRDETLVSLLISRSYLESYLSELRGLIICDTPLGPLDCGIAPLAPSGQVQRISWRAIARILSYLDLKDAIDEGLSLEELIKLRTEPPLRWLIDLIVADSMCSTVDAHRTVLTAALRFADRWQRPDHMAFDGVRDRLWRLWEAATAGREARRELLPPNADTARLT